jgi:hypothetical protein
MWLVANALEHDPGLRAQLARYPNARVAEETHGAGVYEAVVTTLGGRRMATRSSAARPGPRDHPGAHRRPGGPRKVLAVGCIHGNEPAGRGIVADLIRASPAPDTQLLLVRDMNPDGFAHHQRANAHGVDLNRNSPEHWAGAGARAVVRARDPRHPRPHPRRAPDRQPHTTTSPSASSTSRRAVVRPSRAGTRSSSASARAPVPAAGQHHALAERPAATGLSLRGRAGGRTAAAELRLRHVAAVLAL